MTGLAVAVESFAGTWSPEPHRVSFEATWYSSSSAESFGSGSGVDLYFSCPDVRRGLCSGHSLQRRPRQGNRVLATPSVTSDATDAVAPQNGFELVVGEGATTAERSEKQ